MSVSLVIPGRNCQRTVAACLEAVVPLLAKGELREIIFVDDGSTDETASIVARYPEVTYIRGEGRGRGAARNIGWQRSSGDLIWFIDSDTVAEPDALATLLPHMHDPAVAGVGGSYGNMERSSLLACLIHEEIISRHLRMPREVDFLATFNVVYRRSVLEQVNGFSDLPRGQDAELAYRIVEAGYRLRFESASCVAHFHPTGWMSYLRTQRHHGAFRICLYRRYPKRAKGDAYSGFVDHIQPPLAMLSLALAPVAFFSLTWWIPWTVLALLLGAQLPMTIRIVLRTGKLSYVAFAAMGALRAYWRGAGAVQGVVSLCLASGLLQYRIGHGNAAQYRATSHV